MRKLRFLIIFCAISLFITSAAFAEMRSLTESELHKVTAQAGVFIDADQLGMNSEIETIAYGSNETGWISLNGVKISTFVNTGKPIEIGMVHEYNPYEGRSIDMLKIDFQDVDIRMDELFISSISVGPRPGEGPSFGSIAMTGFHANMSGNVRIWTH